jgi:hypothetical protein
MAQLKHDSDMLMRSILANPENRALSRQGQIGTAFCDSRCKSYDRELQRQRCKFLQHHGLPSAFQKQKYFIIH